MLITIMRDVLLGLAVVTAYAAFVLVLPKMNCTRCKGWGSRKKRARRGRSPCGKCAATGRQFRPGARLVHAGAVLAFDAVREQLERRREADQ